MVRAGLILVLIALLAAPSAAQVYEWVDENGVKRYSNVAPGEDATDVRRVDEDKSAASAAAPSTSPPPDQEPPQPAQQPAGAPEDAGSEPEPEETAESVVETARLDMTKFPITQDQLIEEEAERLRMLQEKYDELGLSSEKRIAAERNRLFQAISDLNSAPLPKFGSQDNKRRQVGYYRYRLQDLENSTEEYFQLAAESGGS